MFSIKKLFIFACHLNRFFLDVDSLGLNVIIRQDNVIFITKLGATVLALVDQSVDTFLLRCKLLATPPNFRSQNNVNISKRFFLFAIHNSEGISLATTQKPSYYELIRLQPKIYDNSENHSIHDMPTQTCKCR